MSITPTNAASGAWKTIQLGAGPREGSEFLDLLQEQGFRVGKDLARFLAEKGLDFSGAFSGDFDRILEPASAVLVRKSMADLGFEEWATYEKICRRGYELGYGICPAEVGPQLRLQYSDQPWGEHLAVAMRPVWDGWGYVVFTLGHDEDGCWVSTGYTNDLFAPPPSEASVDFIFLAGLTLSSRRNVGRSSPKSLFQSLRSLFFRGSK